VESLHAGVHGYQNLQGVHLVVHIGIVSLSSRQLRGFGTLLLLQLLSLLHLAYHSVQAQVELGDSLSGVSV